MKLLLLFALATGIGANQLVLINPTQSSYTGGRVASNAIDGDEYTAYVSGSIGTEQWIQFDLEHPSTIDTVTMLGR